MKLAYEDLLSGVPIPVENIGSIRPPKLKELTPQGIGMSAYNLFLSVLSWEKGDFLKHIPASQATILSKNDKLNLFDMMAVLKEGFRDILHQALAFFIAEKIIWDNNKKCFLTFREAKDGEPNVIDGHIRVGEINRDNFTEVCDMILQLNYMDKKEKQEPKFLNERAKKRYEKMQARKKEGKNKSDERFRLGNIISKMSVAKVGYTLLNIWDLTIYQLYDSFSQYSFMRSTDLSEKIYANHGGEKFRYEAWLNTINNS